ncbi:MAG: MBL fold metallo-hydrolase [Candidatus Hydrogenedentes bacterium]|nr:MBL fold metallo-hydrolase [Candidatus Hydrogenedentota bacterium]
MLRLTLLVDDVATGQGLIAEHGLSFWAEYDGRNYLFDTGQGHALCHNARALGIDLKRTDAICLSHGHYDHTGAVEEVLELSPDVRVYAHPDALLEKYALTRAGTARFIGTPEPVVGKLRAGADLVRTEAPTLVYDGMYLTGPIPRVTEFEDTGGPFFRDTACEVPDELMDDQAAYVDTRDGLVVILGCAHAGVINTLTYIQHLTCQAPLHTVIGGMHLVSADSYRLDRTVEALAGMGVRRLLPLHCTGFEATARLLRDLPAQTSLCPIGTVLEYN